MAKNTEKTPQGIIINQITVNRVNRQVLDIEKWRTALLNADAERMTLLYDLYEDIMLDGRLWDAIDRRIRAVTGSDITFQYKDGSESEEVISLIDSDEFEYMLHEIMQALFWGVSLLQLDFTKGMDVYSVPRKHIRTRTKTVATNQSDIDGSIPYSSLNNVVEVISRKDRLGLILRAAPYVIMMRGGIGYWAQMVELFGMPQRVGKYSIYDQEARKQLEQAFEAQGAAASMVVPKETDVETSTGAGSVNSGIYKDFIDELKEALLVTVLSNTMTTLDGSSRAQGEVHQDVEDEVNKSDLRFVQRILNTKVLPILEARGYKVSGGSFVFPKATKELTVEEIVSLSDLVEIPAYYVQEKYGIPQATDGEKLARKSQATTDNGQPTTEPPTTEPPTPPVETSPAASKKDKELKLADDDRNLLERFFDFFADARTTWSRASLNLADTSTNFTRGINIDKLFEQALREIYDEYELGKSPIITKPLFEISNTSLQRGVDTGIASGVGRGLVAEFGKTNEEFIATLKGNTATFAAFKTHAQANEIAAQLVDENGSLRSFDQFRKTVLGTTINRDYNKNWLKTEYNTAVRSSRMAAKWKQIEKTKRLYPNVEFLESTAANKRPEHLNFVGTILPIEHPFWLTHTPPLDWGCECSIRATDKEPTGVPDVGEPIDTVFDNNPGVTAEIINMEQHPYFTNVNTDMAQMIKELVKQLLNGD
jgi:phage gp29-like protein